MMGRGKRDPRDLLPKDASGRMGQLMLFGWGMMGDICEKHACPLMQQPIYKNRICVDCQIELCNLLIMSQNKIEKDGDGFKIKDRKVKVVQGNMLELVPETIEEVKEEKEEPKPAQTPVQTPAQKTEDPVLAEMKKREDAAL